MTELIKALVGIKDPGGEADIANESPHVLGWPLGGGDAPSTSLNAL